MGIKFEPKTYLASSHSGKQNTQNKNYIYIQREIFYTYEIYHMGNILK